MKEELYMTAKKIYISAASNTHEVKLPLEFVGKDIVVSFWLDEKISEPVDPKTLLGIMNVPSQTVDELRAERLGLV